MVGELLTACSGPVACHQELIGSGVLVRRLHGLVTNGPRDLEIASAMSAQGYDAVKWAEGQGMLAELVTFEAPERTLLDAAAAWYDDASAAAQRALGAHPQLLNKLGLAPAGVG